MQKGFTHEDQAGGGQGPGSRGARHQVGDQAGGDDLVGSFGSLERGAAAEVADRGPQQLGRDPHLGLGLDFSFSRQCGLRPSSLYPRATCLPSCFVALRCPVSLGRNECGSPLGRNNGERLLSSLHSPHALVPHEYVAQNFGEA